MRGYLEAENWLPKRAGGWPTTRTYGSAVRICPLYGLQGHLDSSRVLGDPHHRKILLRTDHAPGRRLSDGA